MSKPGFNIIGYSSSVTGTGAVVRYMARSMAAAGIPFAVLNVEADNPAKRIDHSLARFETQETPYCCTLLTVPVFSYPTLYSILPPEAYQDRTLIGSIVWELPNAPAGWEGPLSFLDEIWVSTSFVKDSVAPVAECPISIVPPCMHPFEGPAAPRSRFGFGKEYIFLTMFDYRSEPERKNPLGTVRAFKAAFRAPSPEVTLVVKINNFDRHHPFTAALEAEIEGWGNIRVIREIYDTPTIWSLMNAADCVVSLHRSEGFGLVCAEAMQLGKPVIATGWSGNIDFMDDSNSCLVPASLITLDRDHRPYERGNRWADPDLDAAANWMRTLFDNRRLGISIGKRGRRTIEAAYAPSVIGSVIRKKLESICG